MNRIGPFPFLSLAGEIGHLKQELELVMRPGVPGTGIWRTGVRGRPFPLMSEVDAVDHVHARQLYHAYRSVIGLAPVTVEWLGYHLSSDGFSCVVLDVQIREIFKLLNSTNGINPPSRGYLICQWDLLPVSV